MKLEALETFTRKSDGTTVHPGDILDLTPEKAAVLIEKGRAKAIGQDAPGTVEERPIPGETVRWVSPLFGELEAPVLELGPETFTLRHPLTGEVVTLPNEWLVSLDERAAILEYDGGVPREDADKESRRQFFGLFRITKQPKQKKPPE